MRSLFGIIAGSWRIGAGRDGGERSGTIARRRMYGLADAGRRGRG